MLTVSLHFVPTDFDLKLLGKLYCFCFHLQRSTPTLIFLLPSFLTQLFPQPYFKVSFYLLHPARLLSSVCRIYTCLWFPLLLKVSNLTQLSFIKHLYEVHGIYGESYFNSVAWNIIEASDWYVLAEHLAGWFGLKTGTNYDTLWVMILLVQAQWLALCAIKFCDPILARTLFCHSKVDQTQQCHNCLQMRSTTLSHVTFKRFSVKLKSRRFLLKEISSFTGELHPLASPIWVTLCQWPRLLIFWLPAVR